MQALKNGVMQKKRKIKEKPYKAVNQPSDFAHFRETENEAVMCRVKVRRNNVTIYLEVIRIRLPRLWMKTNSNEARAHERRSNAEPSVSSAIIICSIPCITRLVVVIANG